jgi:hypothetical protein
VIYEDQLFLDVIRKCHEVVVFRCLEETEISKRFACYSFSVSTSRRKVMEKFHDKINKLVACLLGIRT